MLIRVLGSSADKIHTGEDPRDKRTRSSIAINDYLVIDAGPDFWQQIKREQIKPKYILITHSHPDHIKGLYQKETNAIVYATKQILDEIPRAKIKKKKIIALNRPFKIEDLKIIAFKVDHSKLVQTCGFRINNLVYVPDIKRLNNKRFMKNADVLVLDGSILNRPLPVHASIKEQIKWAKELKPKMLYFTHIGKSVKHQELVQFLKENYENNSGVFYDGMRIEI